MFITFLNIRQVSLGDKGLAILCRGLKFCMNLRSLNIAKNDISNEGAKKFSHVLANLPIEELDMNTNPISNSGAESIF